MRRPLGVADPCSLLLDSSLNASSYKRWDPLCGLRIPQILNKSLKPSGWSGNPPGREEPCWPGLGGSSLRFVFHSLTCHSLSHSLPLSFTLSHSRSLTHSQASLRGRGPGLVLQRRLLAESHQGTAVTPTWTHQSLGANRFLC